MSEVCVRSEDLTARETLLRSGVSVSDGKSKAGTAYVEPETWLVQSDCINKTRSTEAETPLRRNFSQFPAT